MLFSYNFFTFSQPFSQLPYKFYNRKIQNIHLTQPKIKIKMEWVRWSGGFVGVGLRNGFSGFQGWLWWDATKSGWVWTRKNEGDDEARGDFGRRLMVWALLDKDGGDFRLEWVWTDGFTQATKRKEEEQSNHRCVEGTKIAIWLERMSFRWHVLELCLSLSLLGVVSRKWLKVKSKGKWFYAFGGLFYGQRVADFPLTLFFVGAQTHARV